MSFTKHRDSTDQKGRSNLPCYYQEHEKGADATKEVAPQAANNNEEGCSLKFRHMATPRKRTKENIDHALMPKINVNTEAVKMRRQSKAAVYDGNDENEDWLVLGSHWPM